MISKTMRTCSSIFLFLLLTGCLAIGKPTVQFETIISQIEVAVTTKEEILDWLGEPHGRTVMIIHGQKHNLWTYTYDQGDHKKRSSAPDATPFALSPENEKNRESVGITIALSKEGVVQGLSYYNFSPTMNPNSAPNAVADNSINDDS